MADGTTNALLVIADIGGYTRVMTLHRTSLAHALTARTFPYLVGLKRSEVEG